MPASIHSPNEVSEPVNTTTLSSPSPSLSTISCDSIKTIKAWLDNVERGEVTVFAEDLGKAGPELPQEPEAKNTRKRKYSSSPSEENFLQSSLRKRSQHLSQLITGYAMADNTMEAGQMPISPEKSSVDMPSTPSTSKTKFKIPTDAGWVGSSLAMHGLKCDHQALGKYPEFEKMVFDIALSKRHSEMKPESAQRIQRYSQICEEANEATFLNTLLPLINKANRTVEFGNHGLTEHLLEMSGDGDMAEVLNPQPGVMYGSRDWIDDGVYAVSDQDFRNDLLPHRYVDEQLAQTLKKDDSMLTPRPDRCYGLLPGWIPVPEDVTLTPEIRALIEACPHLSHPFFLIEGKSNNGSKFDAQNQARRGGASLVNAMRQLLTRIDEPHVTESGVDNRNFVYSATLSPGLIDFWVHWAELKSGTAIFHMNRINSLALNNKQQLPEVRKILNNIMTWGWDLKARRLADLHEKIYTWQRKETARMAEEARQKKDEEKESRKRQRQR